MPRHELRPDTWVDQYSDALFRHALLRVRDRDLARDLVQETFFIALRSKDGFRGEVSEKNWLFLIMRSRLMDYYKKKKEVLESSLPRQEDNDDGYFSENGHWSREEGPESWHPDRMAESSEFMEILRKCKERLNELQEMVFTMKYLDDIDSEIICKELNISSSNYWVLVHRAKLQLRRCLDKNWMR